MERIRVLIADDHPIVLEGLKALVNAQPGMEVVGAVGDGRAALEQGRESRPDVVVMDVSMPNMNGVQATAELVANCPEIRVLALTVHEDKAYLRQLLDAGASGYLLKRAAAEELVRAIQAVAAGEIYLDPILSGKVVAGLVHEETSRRSPARSELSERENEVVQLIAQGYTNKEIATRLNISVKTVETHKARSMEKLGLYSRAELVRYALDRGWLASS